MIGSTGVILKYGCNLHLLRLTIRQHYLQGLWRNSKCLLKSSVNINCICNKDWLWCKSPVTIAYNLSLIDIIQTTGLFSKIIQYTMPILSTIPTCTTPPCVWATVLLTIYLLRFRVDGLKFSKHIGCTRKLLDPHFHEIMWPISVHPCWYTIACLPNCSHANELQTTPWCLQFCFVLFCFERECVWWVRVCVEWPSTMVSSLKSWLSYFGFFPELPSISPPPWRLLLCKVYWTVTITLNSEDELGS